MPTKPRREDLFIKTFVSAYENLSWADAELFWVDQQQDRGVEVVATRKSDGKTLAIEHTVAEPFVGEIEDFNVFFKPSFLKLNEDKSLIVPDRWIQVFVPVRTMEGHKRKETSKGIVEAVREWISTEAPNTADGQHDYQCPVRGVPGVVDFDITLTVTTKNVKPGSVHVRRQQVKDDFPDVIRNIMERKVKKLANQPADKRVLILERQHRNLTPEMIMAEIAKQAPSHPDMALIDEVWTLETIGYEGIGHYIFELSDEHGDQFGTITCKGPKWTSRSGKDHLPICND